MENILSKFYVQLIATLVLFVLLPILRYVTYKITMSYARSASIQEARAKVMLKYLYYIINGILIICLIVIWGVSPTNLLIAISSIFGVIGVAMFAQWSILSNIAAGVIIFFSTSIKIGDRIRILDKDIPVEADIEDIKAFHIHLLTVEGERIIYPNSLLLQKGIAIVKPKDRNNIFNY